MGISYERDMKTEVKLPDKCRFKGCNKKPYTIVPYFMGKNHIAMCDFHFRICECQTPYKYLDSYGYDWIRWAFETKRFDLIDSHNLGKFIVEVIK